MSGLETQQIPDPRPEADGTYRMRYINAALGLECIISIPAKKPGAALYAGATMRSNWNPKSGGGQHE